jgi:hypothetical protein
MRGSTRSQRAPGYLEGESQLGEGSGIACRAVGVTLHALTVDNGWREVADTALTFIGCFTS